MTLPFDCKTMKLNISHYMEERSSDPFRGAHHAEADDVLKDKSAPLNEFNE